jgi:hypothetical protein
MKKSELVFLGVLFIVAGIIFVCRQPRNFEDDAMYHVTLKRNGTIKNEYDSSGRSLNTAEPYVVMASRLSGSFFLLCGSAILIYQYHKYRNRVR